MEKALALDLLNIIQPWAGRRTEPVIGQQELPLEWDRELDADRAGR